MSLNRNSRTSFGELQVRKCHETRTLTIVNNLVLESFSEQEKQAVASMLQCVVARLKATRPLAKQYGWRLDLVSEDRKLLGYTRDTKKTSTASLIGPQPERVEKKKFARGDAETSERAARRWLVEQIERYDGHPA